MKDKAFQKCINPQCGREFGSREVFFKCPACGDLLDIKYNWDRIERPSKLSDFSKRWSARNNRLDFSGVWRFRELLDFCPDEDKVSVGEGQTLLQSACGLASDLGMKPGGLFLQYEGMNPSGSFKDNGMTAAFSHAKMVAAAASACASTGNTSASMALYAHSSGIKATVFIGEGKIAFGKLSQAMDYGAHTIQVAGDFDDCMRQVQDVCTELNIYLVNSLNPFRLEGQKTIMLRIIEGLGWEVPDWIIVPGGNLGNSSSFGKAFAELKELGLIDRVPRLAVINASGANTLTELVNEKGLRWNGGDVDQQVIDDYYDNLDATNYRPDTIASAIEISRPVNLKKCLRALDICEGVVLDVSDEEILDAKAQIGACGLGCEPASAATIAGLKHLLANGTVDKDARVVCVLTGHLLKDPDATVNYHGKAAREFSNPPVQVENDFQKIIALIKS
ncbi:MAG: threonine synthase [Planctomycetales bacterium 4572_13]|nr:MAG: threonine synthase [Planctomycetales bacterium 4572_13]